MLNKKMLIAPILAVALVLLLTGAINYLPLSTQTAPKSQSSTVSTPAPTSQPGFMYSTNSSGASPSQSPVPAPAATAPPAPASVTQTVFFLPVLFVVVAVVLGIVAVQVLFREKELKKELNSEGEK
jgi:hypothetical protein